MAIGDAADQLLWVCGQPGVLRRVESIHFVEGAMWDEGHAGTNAPGTALRLDEAVQIRAAEHFVRPVRRWSCTAAPIHEPDTGAILGIVDITGGEDVASPQTLGMVRAAARMAEAELARISAVESRPRGLATFGAIPGAGSVLRPAAAVLRIRALGRLDAEVRLPGQSLRLSPRHSEIVTVLAAESAGLTGEQLAIEVYPDDNAAPTSTMRAELTRLRSLLGAHVLDSRPYRLIVDVESDVQDVRSLLAAGRVRDAVRLYVGPLLPQSDAPGVVERRDRLQAELRAAVFAAGLPELMVAWTRSRWGADDIAMWRRQAVALPQSSPLRALAAAEADRLGGRWACRPGGADRAALTQPSTAGAASSAASLQRSRSSRGGTARALGPRRCSAVGRTPIEGDHAMPVFSPPGQPESPVTVESRYGNFIGGDWVPPTNGRYFENPSPVNGQSFTEIARSTGADIDLALDAAHGAAGPWGRTSPTERARILNKIADRIEDNLEMLAVAETWDNGKPIRECMAADLPLAADHFRYFASAIRAQEGSLSQLDEETVAYHFHETLGVVGQIIPWNFPILMATWKLAPALAAGNCVVLKPAEQTPWSILKLMELIADLLPAGVLNIVNGFGVEAGKPLASSSRIAKIAFTGETTTGRLIMQYASQNVIPVTLELGGKSPSVFFEDVASADDAFYDKALEGFTLFALNQGEVCTCPSRALIQSSIYDKFMGDALARTEKIIQGNPLDTNTMIGAQASNDQLEKDPVLPRHRSPGGRQGPHRRCPRGDGRRSRRWVLRPADDLRGPELDADLPGGDLRAGGLGHPLRRRGRCAQDGERHALRPRCRCVEPRRRPRVPDGPRHPGGSGVDELLPRVPGRRGVRWLQGVGHRT